MKHPQLEEANKIVPELDVLVTAAAGLSADAVARNHSEALKEAGPFVAIACAFREGALLGYLWAMKQQATSSKQAAS